MAPRGVLPLLLLALAAASCGEGDAAVVPGAAPPSATGAGEAGPSDPRESRPPLPVAPADEADRLRGLIRLLEWGDSAQVEFAQGVLSTFPDGEAAARALEAAGDRNLATNPAMVHNVLDSVKGPDLGRRLLPFFLRCLGSRDHQVRRLAAMAYAQSAADPDRALLARLAADPWHPVSDSALRGLRLHPGPASAAALRAALPATASFARAAALSALGALGDPASLPLLRAEMAAARDGGEEAFPVFLGAAQGLALLGDPEGVEALRGYCLALPLDRPAVPLDHDASAWEGPEWILARAADPVLRGRLFRQAREAVPGAAAAAVRLLREYPADPAVLGAFLSALERRDWETVLEGLDALRAAGSPDALARTLAALVAPDTDRRFAAVLALGRFRDPATVEALAKRLAVEPDASVARKIADALGLIGDPAGAPALLDFLRSEDAPTPDRALRAFQARANLRGPLAAAASPALARIVADPAAPLPVRFHGARALGLGPRTPEAVAVLAGLLGEEAAELRAAGADALGDLGDPAGREALCRAYAREPEDTVAVALRDAILRIDLRNP